MQQDFRDFVAARGGVLWRTAWLLTGDDALAEELLQRSLARVWSRRAGGGPTPVGPEAEALAALLAAFVPRRGGDEVAADSGAGGSGPSDGDAPRTDEDRRRTRLRGELVRGLATLAPRQRAVAVLRHAERLDTAQVAALVGRSPQRVAELDAEASTALRRTPLTSDPDREDQGSGAVAAGALDDAETFWVRRWLADSVPDPPYAPDRAARAVRRGRRRRATGLVAGVAAALALVALVASALAGGAVTTAGPGTAGPATTQRVLVDPLPIPRECADIPDDPPHPDLPLDPYLAGVVWLRFCPTRDPTGALGSLDFAPDVTVVSADLGAVVRRWVEQPSLTCGYRSPVPAVAMHRGPPTAGTVRMQLGTSDGVTHVVDVDVDRCGAVQVDGHTVAIGGRRFFADVVTALSWRLAEQYASQPPRPAPGASDRAHCPADPDRPAQADRTIPGGYPAVPGLALPLPAEAGLVCGYRSGAGAGAGRLTTVTRVPAAAAERIRLAYLSGSPPGAAGCRPSPGAAPYAVVLTDVTGSWRSFGLDRVHCDLLTRPGDHDRRAGAWLLDLVVRRQGPGPRPGPTLAGSDRTWGMRMVV